MTTKYSKSIITVLLIATSFIACKDKNNDETGVEFPEEFQKVWQDDFSASEDDIIGIHFTNTKVVIWDYMGDDFDQGDDCYEIFEAATLVSFEGDIYTIDVDDPESEGTERIEAEITIESGKLNVDDAGGDDPVTYSDTGDSVSDLSPVCTEQTAKRKYNNLMVTSPFIK